MPHEIEVPWVMSHIRWLSSGVITRSKSLAQLRMKYGIQSGFGVINQWLLLHLLASMHCPVLLGRITAAGWLRHCACDHHVYLTVPGTHSLSFPTPSLSTTPGRGGKTFYSPSPLMGGRGVGAIFCLKLVGTWGRGISVKSPGKHG